MRFGVHVPIARGLPAAAEHAQRLGCETIQIFASNPNSWKFSTLDIAAAETFRNRLAELDIRPLFLHTAYLLNLAAPDPLIYQRSVEALRLSIRRAEELGAEYVVTHIGSHKGEGYEAGAARIADALRAIPNSALRTPHSALVMVLLENSAGAGNAIGSRFEELADILSRLGDSGNRVGICLDTAHLYGAGYDLATADGLEQMVSEFDGIVGLSRLHLLHLNDTNAALGSRRDRHWHIGHGNIGLEGFERIVNHPRLRHLPGILETPMEDGWDERNLEAVHEVAA